jgi:hypothetical protein
MKKYLDKTEDEKVSEDIEHLTDWHKQFGLDSLIDLVAKRHTFINTRALRYRKELESRGVNIDEFNVGEKNG